VTAHDERTVVVGVDGSQGSVVALGWALDHADQMGVVTPVMTFLSGPFEYGFGTVEGPTGTGEPYRSEAVLRLRRVLETHAPSLVDDGRIVEHRAGPGLVEAAAGAELLVVGSRGWSQRMDLSIGSVGSYCARHSPVPVALIPPETPAVHDRLDVVVGFDGSANAHTALQWTLTHLRPSARVTVVQAIPEPTVIGEALQTPPAGVEDDAYRALEDEVAGVLAGLDGNPAVDLLVAPGEPRAVLREASADADLLVVGSRGHGVLDRLLLGSVAVALSHHPTIPTVVVPHAA
jgi:nucleotide-binding universal stress UspA family protein